MELSSQIEVHGCYEQFLRHCSKANQGMPLACFCPLDFGSRLTCPLTWGCCFIYDLYLVYCSLFLLSHFHQLISNSDSHLAQLQKLHVCVTLFSSCLDQLYQKFLCLFLCPFLGQGGREWVKLGLSLCLFLNKASLKLKRYHLLPQEAGSCLAQGHNYSFIIKTGSHWSGPPSLLFSACWCGFIY